MKVSTKWLNDYVKVDDLDPLALSEKIERTAVEVDEYLQDAGRTEKNRRRARA